MTKKQLSIFILLLTVAVSPFLAGAETKKSESREPNDVRKEVEINDDKKNDSRGSTTKEISNKIELAKTRTIQAATNILQKTNRELNKIKNIIYRLTNKDSIVAKLDAKGANTTAIKAKLDSAKTLITKVEDDLLSIKSLISSTTTSSTPNIKTKVAGVRKLLAQANLNLKLALTKIKEANKLIREIPGIREIEKNKTASSTPSTGSGQATTTSQAN